MNDNLMKLPKAVYLSAFLLGAGQIYCGQVRKGIAMLAVFLIIPVAFLLSIVASLFFKPGIIIFLAVYLLMLSVWFLMSAVAMLDAYEIAKISYNKQTTTICPDGQHTNI